MMAMPGRSIFKTGQFAQRKHHVADAENDAGRRNLPFGEWTGVDGQSRSNGKPCGDGQSCAEEKCQTHVESVYDAARCRTEPSHA